MNISTYNNPGLQIARPELLEQIHELPVQDLNWLSGFCAGLARVGQHQQQIFNPDLQSEQLTQQQSQQLSTVKTLVLYASQSGNSQTIAQSLQQKLSIENIQSDIKSCDELTLKQLNDYTILLIIASTYGEGEAPDNSIDLLEMIQSKKAPDLSHLQHAVLSLGDSSYEFFCQTGKDFEQVLLKLNSDTLTPRVDCDIDFEDQAQVWTQGIIKKIKSLNESKSIILAVPSATIYPITAYDKKNPYMADVLDIQKITGKGSEKNTYHLELSIKNSGFQYSAGDSVGVWATNNTRLVEKILKHSNIERQSSVIFKNESFIISTLLSKKLELTLLNKSLLTAYNSIANNAQLDLMINSGAQEYIEKNQFLDLLIDYPTLLTAEQLVALLNPIRPRLYSIASSQEEIEDEVHLTINVVSENNANGQRDGMASNHLVHQLEEEQQVAIYVDHNPNFKLPEDNKNIILIGPGTGIAPFRAFLQQRDSTKAKGNNWLFFGNPKFNTDFLYQTELKKYLGSGLLSKLDLAFSRDQESKIYVQHKLLENAAQLWQWIENENASIYICGDRKKMAKDVENTLLRIIQNEGNKTIEQAKYYLNDLRKSKRYQRDVY
jgi:sulfite reductase (NADPH) flavoprotein alpha-component